LAPRPRIHKAFMSSRGRVVYSDGLPGWPDPRRNGRPRGTARRPIQGCLPDPDTGRSSERHGVCMNQLTLWRLGRVLLVGTAIVAGTSVVAATLPTPGASVRIAEATVAQ